jgi:hypothetical protein
MKKKINIGVKRSAFCVRQTAFALIAAVGALYAVDAWGTDKSSTPPVASCTASESIAVDSRMGGLSTVAPKSVSYSSCWCGEKNTDNYVVIDTVLHGGMFNEEIVASVTNRTAGNAEYAEGSISIGVPGEVRCVRLTHRVYDKDGVEIGEALIRDVAFGVASTPSTAAFADSRTNSLQVAVDGVSDAGEEVEQAACGLLVGLLEVEDNGAAVEKVVSDLGNIVEALGLDNLQLKGRAADLHAVILCGCRILILTHVLLLGLLGVVHLALLEIVLDLLGVEIRVVICRICLGIDAVLDFVKKSHFEVPPNILHFQFFMIFYCRAAGIVCLAPNSVEPSRISVEPHCNASL